MAMIAHSSPAGQGYRSALDASAFSWEWSEAMPCSLRWALLGKAGATEVGRRALSHQETGLAFVIMMSRLYSWP